LRELIAEFRRGAAADRPILAGLLLVWIALLAILAFNGVNGFRFFSYLSNLVLYLSALLFFLVYWLGSQLLRHRPERPISFLAASFGSDRLGHRLMRGAPMLLALVIFMPAFSAMKSAIPLINAYTWDGTWIRIDRTLHGTDPWRMLNLGIGYPIVTSIVAAFYHLWILLIYAGGVYFCFFQSNRELRARYFIAYFASWTVLGVSMAIAFASVGPAFVGPLLGDRTFDEQMTYLRGANEHFPVMVLAVQDQLIAWHHSGNHGLGRGLSAMPSMHVSLAFLFFLAMRKVSRLAGIVFGLFFTIVLIGSVHLAYHYAVDGYVSIAVTGVIWMVSGVLARRLSGADDHPSEYSGALPA
jgi:hypothetical protein